MDIQIPVSDTGRDLRVTADKVNKAKYIVKSLPMIPVPEIMTARIQRALAQYGISANVFANGNKIIVEVEGQSFFI